MPFERLKGSNSSIIPIALVVAATICVSSAVSIWGNYTSKRELAALQTSETLRFVNELVNHDGDAVISSLRTIGEVARQFAEADMILADIQWDTPLTRTTIVIDRDGLIIADSRPEQPAMGRSVVDREYFSVHTENTESDLYIGPNVRSRVDGHWSLPISIAVRDPNDNSLVAVVTSAVDPVAWGQLISERTRHLDIALKVTDLNDVILTTAPFNEEALGTELTSQLSKEQSSPSTEKSVPSKLFDIAFPETYSKDWISIDKLPIKVFAEINESKIYQDFLNFTIINSTITIILIIFIVSFFYLQQLSKKIVQRTQTQFMYSLQASSEGFALFDPEGRLVISNSVFRNFYETQNYKIKAGMTLEEMLRKWLAEGAYPPAKGIEEAWIAKRLKQHFAGGTSIQQLADGRWLQVSDQRTADGGIISVRTDITELKQQEKDLRQSRKRFQDFAETASDWMWETDTEHRVAEFGHVESLAKIIDLNDVLGKRRDQFAVDRTDTEEWRRHFADLDNRRPFRNFQYWTKANKDQSKDGKGENHLVSISGKPVFDEDGEFAGYRGTGRDLTKEYRASQRLKTTEAKFQTMFESIGVGIVLADETGSIKAFNPAASSIFGYEEAEILDRNVSMLADEEHRHKHDRYIQDYLTTGDAKLIGPNRELPAVRKNGETFPIKLSLAEMSIDGKPQFIASITDISTEKSLEAQLRQSQKLEAVGLMVGGIAHDFNNILGIIIGHLDLASKGAESGSKLEGQISKSLHAANRGADLTRRLLSFSSKSAVKTDRVHVNAVLSELHNLVQKTLTENIHVQMQLDADDPVAYVNAGDFEDAVINLCLNSRDALHGGGEIVIRSSTVALSETEADSLGISAKTYTAVSIEDNGSGIPEGIKDKIFEPFYTTKEVGKGSGLGLAMVYSFVKRSNGSIQIESVVGSGTKITLLLPCPETTHEQENVAVGSDEKTEGISFGNEHVLIVDDEPDLAEVAEQYLSELGFSTHVAHGYTEALSLLQNGGKFDLLFSDVVMPGGKDGYELARKARGLLPDIRVCLVSGYPGADTADEVAEDISYPFLKKPYTRQEVGKILRQVLKSE